MEGTTYILQDDIIVIRISEFNGKQKSAETLADFKIVLSTKPATAKTQSVKFYKTLSILPALELAYNKSYQFSVSGEVTRFLRVFYIPNM